MNLEEMMQDFLKSQTADWLEEDLPAIYQDFPAQKETITAGLANSISDICRQAHLQQEIGDKGPAAYLSISFLRTNVLDDLPAYRIDLYDENFILDETECSGRWEFNFVWNYFEARLERLDTTIRTGMYANKIRSYHLDEVKLAMAEHYHLAAAVPLTQVIIKEAILIPAYADLPKAPNLKIIMGEYLNQFRLIYQEQDKSGTKVNQSGVGNPA
jgi:hypothetical protein